MSRIEEIPDLPALAPGARVGPYRVVDLLGRGGMGEVYLAWDERLERHVALKRLSRASSLSEAGRQRLREEARAAAKLAHPAIVQVHDLLELESGDFIVMERVEGASLRTWVERGPLELGLAVRLARQVADGLGAAHARGMVHRDLKTENVMVTVDGHAKILDFGLALLPGPDGSRIGAPAGTVHAMAPEQILGGELDSRTDLFALGVMLYELVTGARPFAADSDTGTITAVLEREPTPPRQRVARCPERLEELILRLLAKRREARPRSARQVAAELRRMEVEVDPEVWRAPPGIPAGGHSAASRVDDLPTLTGAPPSHPAAVERSPSGSPRRAWRRAALLVAAVVVTAVVAWETYDRPPPLRVAVLAPQLPENAGGDLAITASAAVSASLDTLSRLVGIEAVDGLSERGRPMEAARAVGAAEAVSVAVERWDPIGARVTLTRTGGDGGVRWTASFESPIGQRDLRLVADAVGVQLRRSYSGRASRGGVEPLDVRDEDYRTYVEVWRAFKADSLPTAERETAIASVVAGSPRFLLGHLLAADLALTRADSGRDADAFAVALAALAHAERLAPDDPRTRYPRFRLEVARGNLDRAEATLAELERLAPGDLELQLCRASLAELHGDLDAAHREAEIAAERAPSWTPLLQLALIDLRRGRRDEAKSHLEAVLRLDPTNPRSLAKLAEIELLYGDLAKAAELFRRHIAVAPRRSLYTNLGLTLYLERRYDEAIVEYRHALELDPEHPYVRLNLADAELASGDVEAARGNYARSLARLEALEATKTLSPEEVTMAAQALAGLGRFEEAIARAGAAMAAHPDDGQVALQAAVTFAAAGAKVETLEAVARARGLAVPERWWSLPVFDSIRTEMERENAAGL